MHQFCPLCSKRGFRRRIKALQINFNEALWTCEGEECEWPFGYEDFIYVQREVGNTWSCYWDDDKPSLQSLNECMPVSTELSLYTPPETPAEAIIKDYSLEVLCSDNNATINSVNHSTVFNEIQSTNIAGSSNHGIYCLTSGVRTNNNSKIGNFNTNEKDNLCITDVGGLGNIESISKDILIETDNFEFQRNTSILEDTKSICKRNLETDASEVQLTVKNENISFIKNTDKNQSDTKTFDLEESYNSTEESTTSKLKIKTIEIDGLPPVSLSYQIAAPLLPTTTFNKRTDSSITQYIKNTDKNQDDTKTSNLKEEGGNVTEKSTISNLKIKTIEIDGLPPVSLSYQVPASLLPTTTSNNKTIPSTVQCVNNSQSVNSSFSTTPSNGTHKLLTLINKQPSGRNINAGKRYAKFHFSAIKKKIETTNTNDSLSSNNKCLLNSNKGSSNNKGTDQIQKQDSSKAITSGSSIHANKPVKTEVVKSEPTTFENGSIDSNLNIDILLDDFMKNETLCGKANESYILPDIDDDWINSLLH